MPEDAAVAEAVPAAPSPKRPTKVGPGETTPEPVPTSKRAFMEEYNRLLRSFTEEPGNPGSYACSDCTRSSVCMFCRGCNACYRCSHCIDCDQCNHCTHCEGCKQCNGCTHCVQCELCSGSAYLVFCRNMSDCNYCLGCVGLSKKDFHILNRQFTRTQYFQAVKQLGRELGV